MPNPALTTFLLDFLVEVIQFGLIALTIAVVAWSDRPNRPRRPTRPRRVL